MSQGLIVAKESTLVGIAPDEEEQDRESDCERKREEMFQFNLVIINIPNVVQMKLQGSCRASLIPRN